jgi:putative peptide zinc metalloprotease protein
VLPPKRKEGDEKLPEFKRWVKVLFALYIVVTIPILAFLLFEMLRNVPRILATAWDSFHKQGSALTDAWSGGHYGGVALAVLQMLLLALPVAGLGFTLFTLGRTAMRLLWKWARPTPARRALGSLATAALAALLVYLWLPSLPFGGKSGPVLARNNWTPIAANERGTVSDALPPAVPVPFRSPVIAPTVAPAQATAGATPGTAGTPGAAGTPSASGTPGGAGTPGATGTPGGTPGAIPVTPPSGTPVPTSAPVQAPAAPQAPAPAPITTAPTSAAPATVAPSVAPANTTTPATAAPTGVTPQPTSVATPVPNNSGTAVPAVLPTPIP